MTQTYRKKLIEVALPLKAINEASAREKSIRHGHPSTLHLWWARRPLAACRAVLFASLVDDPDSDPMFGGNAELAATKRAELFNLIEDLVKWENSNNPDVINRARKEIARSVVVGKLEAGELKKDEKVAPGATAYEIKHLLAGPEDVNAFLAEHAPPVLDPFCGGGSIPLEAQRLGLRAYASDLNPVPVLITKALIEIPPKFAGRPPVNPDARKGKLKNAVWHGAQGLAEDVRYYGKWMRDEAEKRVGHLYPKVKITAEMAKSRPELDDYVGQDLNIIAWLWARTVASPDPASGGAHVPLVRSYWLSTKKGKEAYVMPIVDRQRNTYSFDVRSGSPKSGFDPGKGTVVRTGATCLLSTASISFDHIRAEGRAGKLGARLMAIVAEGNRERVFLPPLEEHILLANSADPHDYPETDLPDQALSFRVQLYGIDKHFKLFSPRQLVAMTTLSDLAKEARQRVANDIRDAFRGNAELRPKSGSELAEAYADAVATYLAFGLDKSAEGSTTLCTWSPLPSKLHVVSTFGRQSLPMVWDFAEANIFANSSGNYERMVGLVAEVLDRLFVDDASFGQVSQLDATATLAPESSSAMISTDPPYYSNIGYADLSDFAYVWLRKTLSSVYPSLFATLLTPKSQELIASPYRHQGNTHAAKEFFENGLRNVFELFRSHCPQHLPITVFYAFKQSEEDEADDTASANSITSTGWETMLEALFHAGFVIDGTWPVRTERSGGFRNFNQNALASSIVLVCRMRAPTAPLATRKEFIKALRHELPDALRSLQHGNIAPVDLAQAAIGPGMAAFTRYTKVMEADGSPMSVRTALGIINQVLDEVLAEQEGEFDQGNRTLAA